MTAKAHIFHFLFIGCRIIRAAVYLWIVELLFLFFVYFFLIFPSVYNGAVLIFHVLRFDMPLLVVLQPLRWRCVECVIHHERDVHEKQQYIYLARTSNNRVIMTCELYWCLLPQCEALRTCRSGFSHRNSRIIFFVSGFSLRTCWCLLLIKKQT